MKRRTRIGFTLILTLLAIGLCSWRAHRVICQEQLNRLLIAAIKRDKAEHSPALRMRACLERGADPNARDETYRSALSWNRLMILLGLKSAPVVFAQPALLLAVEGDLKRLEFDGVNEKEDARPPIVKALLQYGADVRVKDEYGRTPLIAAFQSVPNGVLIGQGCLWFDPQNPSMECAMALIAAGADVEARDEDGNTPLMMCPSRKPHESEVDLLAVYTALLHKGANVNATDGKGMTPLICHAKHHDTRVCLLLLDHGADLHAIAQDGTTTLMHAAQNGDSALMNVLLLRGADVNANIGHGFGMTALMSAAEGGHDSIVRTLLQHGASVNVPDDFDCTALLYAIDSKNATAVNTLLQHGANVNRHGWTPLIEAALQGQNAIVRTLLQRGAEVDAQDEDGRTALICAAQRGDEECVRTLLQSGAHINLRYRGGLTFYQFIKDYDEAKKHAVMRLLKQHGMKE